jgi:hypothetical protein
LGICAQGLLSPVGGRAKMAGHRLNRPYGLGFCSKGCLLLRAA